MPFPAPIRNTNKGDVIYGMIQIPDNSADADSALLVDSTNFESRKVLRDNKETLRIKPTFTSLAFSLLFLALGIIMIGFYLASTFTSFDGPGSVPLMLIGVLFAAAGLITYYSSNEQLVINSEVGVVFMQSWNPSVSLDLTSVKKHIEKQDIVAIQTISRVVKRRSNRNTRSATYTEYQVNLCVSDSKRHNLFVTLKSEKADNLANDLVQIFNVPLRKC